MYIRGLDRADIRGVWGASQCALSGLPNPVESCTKPTQKNRTTQDGGSNHPYDFYLVAYLSYATSQMYSSRYGRLRDERNLRDSFFW